MVCQFERVKNGEAIADSGADGHSIRKSLQPLRQLLLSTLRIPAGRLQVLVP